MLSSYFGYCMLRTEDSQIVAKDTGQGGEKNNIISQNVKYSKHGHVETKCTKHAGNVTCEQRPPGKSGHRLSFLDRRKKQDNVSRPERRRSRARAKKKTAKEPAKEKKTAKEPAMPLMMKLVIIENSLEGGLLVRPTSSPIMTLSQF